jgi:hypothetical protein
MRHLPVLFAALLLTAITAAQAQSDCEPLNWGRCNERGTEQKPLVVKQLPTDSIHEKEDNEHELVRATWALVAVTFALALVTGFLFATTRTAARAAKESAEALPKLERAYLFETVTMTTQISGVATQLSLKQGEIDLEGSIPEDVFPRFSVRLVNHGKTPAIIKSVLLGADHFNNTDEPTSWSFNRIQTEHVLNPSQELPYEIRDTIPISEEALAELKAGRLSLKVYGKITYEDVFERSHETAWYWQYNGFGESFQRYRRKGQNYNYRT